MAANSTDGGNNYGLPDGFILDAPAPPAPSAASNYGLPAGFVLDKPAAAPAAQLPEGFEYADEPPAPKAALPSKTFPLPEGYVFADEQPYVAGVPTPPKRPADLHSLYDPVAGYQGQQPPARPSEAEMVMLRSQARDAAVEDMRRRQAEGKVVQWGDKFYAPGNPKPLATIPGMNMTQAAAEKAARDVAVRQRLADVQSTPTDQFAAPIGDMPPDFSGEPAAPDNSPAIAKALAVKQAQAEVNALQQQPIPLNTPAVDLGNRIARGAGQSTIDIAKPAGQIAADLGAPDLQDRLQQAERGLPEVDPIRDKDLSAKVAGGAGGAAPFVLGGALGAGVRTMAAAGALQGFGGQYEAAERAGADKATQYEAGTLGLITGAAQSLPIARLFESAAPGSSSLLRAMGAQALKGSIEFPAIQSAVQIGNNAIAKGLYDKNRDLVAGVQEDAAAAALVGGFLGLGAGAVNFHTGEGRAKVADAAKAFDWADVLGVSPEATADQAHAAFIDKISQAGQAGAGADVQRIIAAYEVFRAGQNRSQAEQPQEQAGNPAEGEQQATPRQEQQQPAPAPEAQPAAAEPAREAPAAPPKDTKTAAEDAALIEFGFDQEDVDAMSPRERARQIKELKAAGVSIDVPPAEVQAPAPKPSPAAEPREAPAASPEAPAEFKPAEKKAATGGAMPEEPAPTPAKDEAGARSAKEAPARAEEESAGAASKPAKEQRAAEDELLQSHVGFSREDIDAMSPARREQELQWAREERDAPRSYEEAAHRDLVDDEPVRAAAVDVSGRASGKGGAGERPAVRPARAAHVQQVVDGLIDDLLPKGSARAEVKDRIALSDRERQAAGVSDREAIGAYDPKRRIVEISAAAEQPDSVAVHEIWHAARDLGLADKNEAAVLQRDLPRLRRFLEDTYPDHDWSAAPAHEVEAYAAQAYFSAKKAGAPTTLHVGIRKVFQRFFDFMNRLWHAVHGNRFQMPEDIFGRFSEGGFKDRAPGESQLPGSERAPSVYGAGNGIGARPKRSSADKLDALRTKMQDFSIPVRRLGEKLEEMTGKKLTDEQNTYLAKRLIPGKVLAGHQEITREFEDPVAKIAKEAGLSLAEIGDRLLADHAPERNAAIDDLHNWRKNYAQRKTAARKAEADALDAEQALAKAKTDLEAKFRAADAQAKRAKDMANLEVKTPGPGARRNTEKAQAAAKAARREVADAERARDEAYEQAKKLRDQADKAARYAETPMEQAARADRDATAAEQRAKAAKSDAVDKAHKATLADDEAAHLQDEADAERRRTDANPKDAAQRKTAERAQRDAIAARKARDDAKQRAHAAEAEADRAAQRAKEMRAAAGRKQASAAAEEKRRDESFDRIKGKGSGITNQQARDILAQHAQDGKTEALDKIASLFRGLREHTIQTALEGGLISPETADAWRTKFSNYADLRGFEDASLAPDEAYFAPSGRRMHIRGEEVKQAFGRTSLSNNPAVNMIEAAHRAIERAEANKAGQTLYRALSSMDPAHLEGVAKLDRGETKWAMDEKTGMAKHVNDPRYAMSPNAVAVKFKGKARYIVFDDARLAESVKRLSPEQVGEIGRMALAYQNFSKFLWTHAAPAFMVRHFLGRYPMEAMLNAGEYGFGAMARAWKSYPIFGVYHHAVRAADGMSPAQRAALAKKVASGC